MYSCVLWECIADRRWTAPLLPHMYAHSMLKYLIVVYVCAPSYTQYVKRCTLAGMGRFFRIMQPNEAETVGYISMYKCVSSTVWYCDGNICATRNTMLKVEKCKIISGLAGCMAWPVWKKKWQPSGTKAVNVPNDWRNCSWKEAKMCHKRHTPFFAVSA